MIRVHSKFVTSYDRLFADAAYNRELSVSWDELLALPVEAEYLRSRLQALESEQFLQGPYKSLGNSLFINSVKTARTAPRDDNRVDNALDTLLIFTRTVLAKNMSGWEIMEVFASGVKESDTVFGTFTSTVNELIGDESAPASIRHKTLQLALTFACGVGQSSPVAYFLRVDLFPTLCRFMRSENTSQFSFEAVILLAVLANYHKSDAAKLNPYMVSIQQLRDTHIMRKMWWASNFALAAAVRSYQELLDDSPPTLSSSLGSFVASLRPDRALTPKPTEIPRDLLKSQPIEATVVLVPIYDLFRLNSTFATSTVDCLSLEDETSQAPLTIISLSSYIFSHASSSSSRRSIAYANLSMNLLLAFAENWALMDALAEPNKTSVRLCRQRLPSLPLLPSSSPPLCAFLDCCVLWLRHNLHLNLETGIYSACVAVCHRTLWFLKSRKLRIEYHWTELWKALIGVLAFVSSKLDTLNATGGIENLLNYTLGTLNYSLNNVEQIVPKPRLIHEFIYELIHSSAILKKLPQLLDSLSMAATNSSDHLTHILAVVGYYEEKVAKSGSKSATGSMRALAREIDKDGVWGTHGSDEDEIPDTQAAKDAFNFSVYLCADTLTLMP